MNKLTFTVINDLSYDQRMHRICNSLSNAGYHVTLIGRGLANSLPITIKKFKQKRLRCFFTKGKLMYLEFNLRLFIYLLVISTDCYVAIDLDTIIPNYFASNFRRKKRVYDAHELFTELKEIVTRPLIHKIWLKIENYAVPKYKYGYTVNEFIANEFMKKYGVNFSVVRNLPILSDLDHHPVTSNRFIIYQGAVNEGRSFETLIPAINQVNAQLVICGDGNFLSQVKQLIKKEGVEEKVQLKGMVPPEELRKLTPTAYAAVMLFEGTGLNQYQSLANRFFDYIMAGVPQVCVDYPQYKVLNDQYSIASLISDTCPDTIANALNNLLNDAVYYNTIRQNCLVARQKLNWQNEEKVLLAFYQQLFK
ncbi:MAG: glycosyltransferase [Bacteroidota bacterium]|nr:glycosyltransferase [Bacteroidota bacterium]